MNKGIINLTGDERSRLLRKVTSDYIHSSGAAIHPNDRVRCANHKSGRQYKIAYTCSDPQCGAKEYAFPSTFRKPHWSGLCKACVLQRGNPRKITGDVPHPSGAIIHFDTRHSDNYHQVLFTCANAEGEISHQNHTSISAVASTTWVGLCSDCRGKRGGQRKYVEDYSLPNGGCIFFSERTGNLVPVSCVLCDNKKHWRKVGVVIEALNRYKRVGQSWTGYCTKHRVNGIAAVEAMIRILKANQHETGGVTVEKRRGRKSGTLGFDHIVFIAEVDNFVLEAWKRLQSVQLITLEIVAAEFQSKGERISGNTVLKRLKICGFNEPWTVYREKVLKKLGKLIPAN